MSVEELKSMTHEDLVRRIQELQEDLEAKSKECNHWHFRCTELTCQVENAYDKVKAVLSILG